MLLKNGERYQLTAADQKLIKEKFRKFPVKLVYPEERIKRPLAKSNIKPDKPASLSFPLHVILKTKTGTEHWRYCENFVVQGNGKTIFIPHNFRNTGALFLDETDIEFIWYLYTKCPYLKGGLNDQGRNHKALIEDLVSKAEIKAMAEEEMVEVKALIYSTKLGLSEEKLRLVAKAYYIHDVDDLTLSQVRIAIEGEIKRGGSAGIQKFKEITSSNVVLTVRGLIQSAIDANIIKYNYQKRIWVWVPAPGLKAEKIIDVGVNVNPYDAIFDYYNANKEFAMAFESALKGKSFFGAPGADNPDGDED